MTNPVSQSELEDVLDAIRRLVAEERAQPRTRQREASAQDKLVLTPALRVHEAPAGEVTASSDGDTHEIPEDASDASEVAERQDRPELVAVADPDPSEEERTDEAARAGEAGFANDERGWEDAAEDSEAETLSALSGEEASEDETDPSPLPETATDDPEDAGASDDAAVEAAPEGDGARHADDRASTLESKIAELEAMVGMSGAWEPDEGDPAPYAAEGGPDSAFGPEPAEDDEAREEQRRETEEAILDEDALRDMVAEIVRQELQGELGERITRNVRKLVRREIHRALASQLFE